MIINKVSDGYLRLWRLKFRVWKILPPERKFQPKPKPYSAKSDEGTFIHYSYKVPR